MHDRLRHVDRTIRGVENDPVTVLEQVRVIDESSGPPEPVRPSPLVLLVVGAAFAVLIAAFPSVTGPGAPAAVESIESDGIAPSLSARVVTRQQLEAAIAVTESLVVAVNSADSEQVISLLAPSLFGTGLGSSEWPMVYGDVGWWGPTSPGAYLNHGAVADFVRYFRALPGGVIVDECRADGIDPANDLVGVTCTYAAFGGGRGLMGDREREVGALDVVVRNGLVADVTNHSAVDELAWNQLGL